MADTYNITCPKCSKKITWEEVNNDNSAYNKKDGLCSDCGEPETTEI